jgi:hypothetical protein
MSPFRNLPGRYRASQLAVLQLVYEEACFELRIDPALIEGDEGRPARALAAAVIDATKSGEWNPSFLKLHAILTFSRHAGLRS